MSFFLLSYNRLSKKPSLFKSFTGLSIQQFNDIYKEIKSKYKKYEIKRLSSKRRRRERDVGAGRHFKLIVEDRVIMVLVYYRLYITYTLAGFLFDLESEQHLQRYPKDRKFDKTMRTNSAENISDNQEVENARGSREIFSGIYGFYRLYRAADSKTY